MKPYWCRFLDERGVVFGAERIEAVDDAAAVKTAFELFANRTAAFYVILDGDRIVHREILRPQSTT